jgi:hypothetical protein
MTGIDIVGHSGYFCPTILSRKEIFMAAMKSETGTSAGVKRTTRGSKGQAGIKPVTKGFAHVKGSLPAAGELAAAIETLARSRVLTDSRSRKLSIRVDPGPFELLAERLGTDNPTEVINAALALAAAPNRFKTWLMTTEDRLPDDYELPV